MPLLNLREQPAEVQDYGFFLSRAVTGIRAFLLTCLSVMSHGARCWHLPNLGSAETCACVPDVVRIELSGLEPPLSVEHNDLNQIDAFA